MSVEALELSSHVEHPGINIFTLEQGVVRDFNLTKHGSLISQNTLTRSGFEGEIPVIIGVKDGAHLAEYPFLLKPENWSEEHLRRPDVVVGELLSGIPEDPSEELKSVVIRSGMFYSIGGQQLHRSELHYPLRATSRAFDVWFWASKRHNLHMEITSHLDESKGNYLELCLGAKSTTAEFDRPTPADETHQTTPPASHIL